MIDNYKLIIIMTIFQFIRYFN